MTNPSGFATGGGPLLAIIGAVLEIVGTHLDRPVGMTPEQVEQMLRAKAQGGRDDIADWFRTHDHAAIARLEDDGGSVPR